LIFPEYFQGDPPVEDVPLANLTGEELLFKWTCKVKNLTPEKLLFRWNAHADPDAAKMHDLEASKLQWDTIYSDHISVLVKDYTENDPFVEAYVDKLFAELAEVEAGQAEVEAGQAEVEAGQAEVEAGQAEVEAKLTQLEAKLTQFTQFNAEQHRIDAKQAQFNAELSQSLQRIAERIRQLKEECSMSPSGMVEGEIGGAIVSSQLEINSLELSTPVVPVISDYLPRVDVPMIAGNLTLFSHLTNYLSQFTEWIKQSIVSICRFIFRQ
jgi:hypothetical protein